MLLQQILDFDFTKAAEQIETHGWIQGCTKNDKGMCLIGAIYCVANGTPQLGMSLNEIQANRGYSFSWNDKQERTKEEVVDYLRSAPKVTLEEIRKVAKTFYSFTVSELAILYPEGV
jgi:hypothetical protein